MPRPPLRDRPDRDDDDRPRPRDDDDDRPARRSRPAREDYDDDRPRRREQDDNDDRGSRRRPPREEEYDEERPRRRDRRDEDEADPPRDDRFSAEEPRRRRRDEEERDEERPRRRPRDEDDDERYRRDERERPKTNIRGQKAACRLGMMFYFIRYVAQAVSLWLMAASALFTLLAALARSGGILGVSAGLLYIGSFGAFFVVPALGIVAGIFAVRSPSKSRAMALAIAALALDALILLADILYIATVGLRFLGAGPFGLTGMGLVSLLLLYLSFLAAIAVQLMLMRLVAIYGKNRTLAHATFFYLILAMCLGAGGPGLVYILAIALLGSSPTLVGVILVVLLWGGVLAAFGFASFRIGFLARDTGGSV